MTLRNYLKDRRVAYGIVAFRVCLTILFLLAFRTDASLILVVTAIDLMAVIFHESWNLYRKKGFYDRIQTVTEELDQKYLLPEMLKEPGFYEGKLMYDTLCSCDKSMAEHVSQYKKQASDFREYIEMWVHEAKIPVAGLRLIHHNHPGQAGDKINVQLRRIDDCIDNVLYFARSENAEKDYIIKEVSLRKIFSHVAVRNREALQLTGATIQTGGLDGRVLTDGKWLEFVLGQLMANSMKYASDTRPLEIRVHAQDAGTETVLVFRDNGIGIRASDLPYIFEKGFTGHNGRRGTGSTGMGLYIVKKLCDRLGHGIHVSSVEGEFTEFRMTFAKNDFYRMR